MRAERERVKALLTEAVTLLCKNSVTYQLEVEVEGLLGITVDKSEVFLVSLHELIPKAPDVKQIQLSSPQFASTPSFSPTASKRKRRRKSGDGTPQIPTKKMTPSSTVIASADGSDAIVLGDEDDGSNGTGDFQEGADSAQTPDDHNLDSSQGQGEPISDTTYDEFQDSEAFPDQSALGSAKAGDSSQTDVPRVPGQVSEEPFGANDNTTPGASDNMVSVKQERLDSFTPQEDDSLGGEGYDGFEHEQKWSATMGMMQPGEGSPGMLAGASFGMSPGTSGQPSNAQRRGRRNIHDSPAFPVALVSNGKYACWSGLCRKEYDTPLQLLVHQYEDGHLDYLCCVCNRVFSRKDILRRHVKSLHLKEHFRCTQCSEIRTFNRKDHYRAHQLKIHGIVMCEECGEAFAETRSLKQHIILEHSKSTNQNEDVITTIPNPSEIAE